MEYFLMIAIMGELLVIGIGIFSIGNDITAIKEELQNGWKPHAD